jgi:spore maturation protein SpmA
VGVVKLVFLQDYEALPEMMDSTFKMSNTAFEMTLGLTGTLTLWMGILKIGEDSGLVDKLARLLSPVLTKLFPEIPKNHPALGSIFMNVSANMLGLDNAATPVGLKAMQELQSINEKKDTASNSMIMFLVLNTSGLTIIPVSIMAYRSKFGAADPADVFIPLLLTTMCSTLVGLLTVSLYQRINLFQKNILILIGSIALLVAALFTAISGMDNEQMQHFCRLLTACLILGTILLFIYSGVHKKLNVYNSFIEGAKGGFHVAVSLIPYCVAILAAVGVFRASGALQMIQDGLTWCVEWCGLNSDFVGAVPVALMKPLNGAGARGMMLECFESFGPDSFVGHLASVLQGSTDTTFYILAIYFGSVGIKKYRYSVACGLMADVAGMVAAVFFSYFFFG